MYARSLVFGRAGHGGADNEFLGDQTHNDHQQQAA
jgi:hypothetical protein